MKLEQPLRRWLMSFPYDDTVQYGYLLGILGLVRRVVAVCTALIVLALALSLWSSAGPADPWRPLVVIVLVGGGIEAIWWWWKPWPTETASLAVVAGADTAIAFVLLTYADPLLAMATTCLYALVGIYVSMLHGPRPLVGHVVVSATLAFWLSDQAVDLGADVSATASLLVALTAIIVGIPLAVQVAWSTIRHEGMRSLLDPLTGLLNRRGLLTAVLGSLTDLDSREPGHVVAVVSVDLDGFKRLNDAHGHEAGDTSLRIVTARLVERWDHGGRWARVGGEELVVVTTTAADDLHRLGLAAVDLIHDPADPHPVTASVGVVTTDGAPPSRRGHEARAWLDQLVHRADRAMYEAKSLGGNRAVLHHHRASASATPAA